MKKLTITIISVLALCISANAQSGYFVGGSLSYSSDNNDEGGGDESTTTSFSFSPMFGKMLGNGFATGLMLDYQSFSFENTNVNQAGTTVNETTMSTIGGGIFGRKYFGLSEMFKPILQLDFGVASGTRETNTTVNGVVGTPNKTDVSTSALNIRPALGLFLGPNWSVEFNFGGIMYSSTKETPDGGTEETTTNLDFDLNANNFGFTAVYYFGSK